MSESPTNAPVETPAPGRPDGDLSGLITRTGIAAWSMVGAAVLI